MNKIRLLLVEDNRLLREGLTAMLNEQPDIEVVAAFGDGEAAVLKATQALKPQIILFDLGLKGQNSLRLVESVKKEHSGVKMIVMDLIPVQADVIEFVKAGVSGFILKDATFADFAGTIRSVAAGVSVLPPSLTGSLFSQIIERVPGEEKASLIESVRMTKREREVIELIAEGLSNKEIAERLNIATYTVKSHVHNILDKLALHTRLQVASYAHTQGTSGTQSA
ncbi:MAG TPA: response regulator transcription factor [Terriglobia bacterium]|nr:response regulator transcription factor [Terriglobia bacterium]